MPAKNLKKTLKKASKKKPVKSSPQTKKRSYKRHLRHIHKVKIFPIKELLAIFLFCVLVLTMLFVLHSVSEIVRTNKSIVKSADGMLAYDTQDIKTAGLVGTVNQLKKEIKGFNKASSDFQVYMIKDYKTYKKNCVVNGEMTGSVTYELTSFAYNSYALINKGCNGNNQVILKKFQNKWSVIYSGNETVSCEIVNEFNIPQPISYNCQTNGKVFVNPNP